MKEEGENKEQVNREQDVGIELRKERIYFFLGGFQAEWKLLIEVLIDD